MKQVVLSSLYFFKFDLEKAPNILSFVVAVQKFYLNYEPIALDNCFARCFNKAQDGFLRELKSVSTADMKNGWKWHRNELKNYASEMVNLIVGC